MRMKSSELSDILLLLSDILKIELILDFRNEKFKILSK